MLHILDYGATFQVRWGLVERIAKSAGLPHVWTGDGLAEARHWVEQQREQLDRPGSRYEPPTRPAVPSSARRAPRERVGPAGARSRPTNSVGQGRYGAARSGSSLKPPRPGFGR
jgi:hypothetical protein